MKKPFNFLGFKFREYSKIYRNNNEFEINDLIKIFSS